MKKTFTLFAIAVLITSASFAQNNQQHNNNYDKNRGPEVAANSGRERNGYGRERGTYYFTARERDMQINSISNECNRKIESVKHKFFVGRYKKEQQIRSLSFERDAAISSVIAKFNDRRNLFDRRDNRYNDHDKKHNW